jgi:uncharacterized membrane protein required for colicin V production
MPEWLSLIDAAFLVAVVFFAWGGFQKGFAAQVAHILTIIIVGGFLFFAYPSIFDYFERLLRSVEDTYIMWLILAATGVLGILIFVMLTKVLAKLLKAQVSDVSDSVYGMLLGLIRGVLAVLLALVFLVMLDSSGRAYDKMNGKSYVGRFVCGQVVPRIQPRLAPAFEEKVQEFKRKLLERNEGGLLEDDVSSQKRR